MLSLTEFGIAQMTCFFPLAHVVEPAPKQRRLRESRKTPFRESPPPRDTQPVWRLAQQADLDQPIVPIPWTLPTWQTSSSETGPEPEPVPYLSHRHGHRTATIRALDPDNLLRHEPPPHSNTYPPYENESEDSDDQPLTSFATHTMLTTLLRIVVLPRRHCCERFLFCPRHRVA